MNELVERFIKLESRMAQEKGLFWLFALFLREESAGGWDILVSAHWIDEDPQKGLRYIAGQVQDAFAPHEMTRLSGVVIIEETHPELEKVTAEVQIEHSCKEFTDRILFGQHVKHAVYITARTPTPARERITSTRTK